MLIYLQVIDSPKEQSKFERLHDTYKGLLYHIAYEILHDWQDAEEAV